MEATVTLKIKIDEKAIAEKYPHYADHFESIDQFIEKLMDSFESPIEFEGKPINYLETYGYEVMIMDRSDKPEEK
jgi:hypothetical protein